MKFGFTITDRLESSPRYLAFAHTKLVALQERGIGASKPMLFFAVTWLIKLRVHAGPFC